MSDKLNETPTIEDQVNCIFHISYTNALNLLEKRKDYLKTMGITRFDTTTLLELTIFFYYINTKSIKIAPILPSLKEQIIQALYKSYIAWLGQWANSEEEADYTKRLIDRLKTYEQVDKMLWEGFEMNILPVRAGLILFKAWNEILSNDLKDDIFSTTRLSTFFRDFVMGSIDLAVDLICKMNLSEDEYKSHKEKEKRVDWMALTDEERSIVEYKAEEALKTIEDEIDSGELEKS